LLVDPAEGDDAFRHGGDGGGSRELAHAKVDVKTPEDLSIKFRSKVVAEARPV
jgi:uncharacterized protein